MLRINLLPIRQLKKRAHARNQIFSFIALFICLLLILGAVAFVQSVRIKGIETSIAQLKQEKKKYDPILAEMKQLEKAKKELERRTQIIKTLKQKSSITVHVLDEVAKKVDAKRMWLQSLKQSGGSLSLKGTALDNRTIAQFMDALKASPYIAGVNLSNSSLKKIAGRDLKNFALTCSVVNPEAQAKAKPQKPVKKN
ncbi:MAG: PilN domain-containing protein [Thermodesulfobacteriota bacterium]